MESSFTFSLLERASFPYFQNPQIQQTLTKWGVWNSMDLFKFRFEQVFSEDLAETFLLDLVNSSEVRRALPSIAQGAKASPVASVNFKKLRCSEVSMSFFNFLKEKGFSGDSGNIVKVIPDWLDDIEIVDKFREAVLMEESEHWDLLPQEVRDEFLFRVFQHLEIGGGMNQYEDYIEPYLETTKGIYKDLVSVKQDQDTQELYIVSQVYQLLDNNQFDPFGSEHPQNFCYVIVDPSYRHVNLWYHRWRSFW